MAPSVTYEQTLWEIVAAIEGHNRVQGGEDELDPPSDAQFDALLESNGWTSAEVEVRLL